MRSLGRLSGQLPGPKPARILTRLLVGISRAGAGDQRPSLRPQITYDGHDAVLAATGLRCLR
jgi:hypothetical protein